MCFLHTVDGCCGQRDKQETNSDFISGISHLIQIYLKNVILNTISIKFENWTAYIIEMLNFWLTPLGYYCNQCWSTKKNCPCDLKERLRDFPKGCGGVKEHSNTGAITPQLTSSVVSFSYRLFFVRFTYFVTDWNKMVDIKFCSDKE